MIKIWARIGVACEISDEKYQELLSRASYKGRDGIIRFGELTLTQSEKKFFMEHGKADGDSYIPQEVFEDIEYKKE